MNKSDQLCRRRAFQLARLSEELALASALLAEQAHAIARASAQLAETAEGMVAHTSEHGWAEPEEQPA
jgi:hypothetical protein